MLSLSNILIKLALVHIIVLLTYVYYMLVNKKGEIMNYEYRFI